MFIFLSKLLPLFVYPLGLASILLILALINSANRKQSMTYVFLALTILWMGSTSGVANFLARSLEQRYLPPVDIPAGDVIVLLGGGTEPEVFPRSGVELNGAGDRVLYAAKLFKEGKSSLILLSGGEITWQNDGDTTPAEDMAEVLTEMGVPVDGMIIENRSRNTYENALYSKELLEEKEITTILLVTSAMHMPRALALFEAQGFEVVPLPVDYSVVNDGFSGGKDGDLAAKLLNIIPNSGNLALTTNALKEYIGIFVYQLQGWI